MRGVLGTINFNSRPFFFFEGREIREEKKRKKLGWPNRSNLDLRKYVRLPLAIKEREASGIPNLFVSLQLGRGGGKLNGFRPFPTPYTQG